MKQITTKGTCAECEEEYELILNKPSWYEKIFFSFLPVVPNWEVEMLRRKLYGLCPKCSKYEKLLTQKEHLKKIKELRNKRDKFLKENK
jgi:hypothetical protein